MTGGGSNEEELPITTAFLEEITNPNILYIPLAMAPDHRYFKDSHTWIADKLGSIKPD